MPDYQDLRAVVASVLQKRRLAHELTQQKLAKRAGLERSYVSLLESGKRMPSIEVIFRLSDAMDVEPVEIIEEIQHEWRTR